ncbi:hypothetical protein H8S90_16970 [Olivibacter sp. SDN3]|uniref:hypothetical protein n=1 Tax=Olivibacter sp. SDN3 TaxID=2764720 RepID=UPI001650E8C6|nr:hypothetical protein [Olivibacter sp. SDN3]QNL48472.1 hypothetical protein H8S90_16970 [Olivibacter sp. SDN3]
MKPTTRCFIFHLILLSTLTLYSHAKGSKYALDNFIIKENLIKNDKLAIIACDSSDQPSDRISGTFNFTINGFKQALVFTDGVAIAPQEIDKSSFVFLKHQNQNGIHTKLYYVVKSDDGLKPIKINWMLLLIVPLCIIIIASIYKRLLLIALIALLAIAYFNYNKGLSFEGIFETIYHGIRNIVF